MTIPAVFLSILLQSAGAKEASFSGIYSPFRKRYDFTCSISVFFSPLSSLWQRSPEGLSQSRIFSSFLKKSSFGFASRNSSFINNSTVSPTESICPISARLRLTFIFFVLMYLYIMDFGRRGSEDVKNLSRRLPASFSLISKIFIFFPPRHFP